MSSKYVRVYAYYTYDMMISYAYHIILILVRDVCVYFRNIVVSRSMIREYYFSYTCDHTFWENIYHIYIIYE